MRAMTCCPFLYAANRKNSCNHKYCFKNPPSMDQISICMLSLPFLFIFYLRGIIFNFTYIKKINNIIGLFLINFFKVNFKLMNMN